jgi:hypothetical protein
VLDLPFQATVANTQLPVKLLRYLLGTEYEPHQGIGTVLIDESVHKLVSNDHERLARLDVEFEFSHWLVALKAMPTNCDQTSAAVISRSDIPVRAWIRPVPYDNPGAPVR